MVVKRGRYEETGGDRDVVVDQNKMDRGRKTNESIPKSTGEDE